MGRLYRKRLTAINTDAARPHCSANKDSATLDVMDDRNIPPLDESTLQILIDQPEDDNLEFKSTFLQRTQIAEYVVGIGNAGGGLLVMGITDKKPRSIVGIPSKSVEELQAIRRSVYDSTGVRVELEPINTAHGFVLAIRIPPRPPGMVFHTSDGKYLIRVGENLLPLTSSQLGTIFAESQEAIKDNTTWPLSMRFTEIQHARYYSVLVTNHADVQIVPKEIWLEKDALKLAEPVRKDWPAIAAHSAGVLAWEPNRNPVDLLLLKWQERKMAQRPAPVVSLPEEIDICLAFTSGDNHRRLQRERVMVLVDRTNRTVTQWS